jgi:hypothetical protein
MKIVVIHESAAEAERLAVIVQEKDLWALKVLVARAGARVLAVKDEKDGS